MTNIMFEHHRTMMGLDPSAVVGGAWLNAAYSASTGLDNLQLHIATVADIPQRKEGYRDGHSFYILPGGGHRNYDVNLNSNIREWEILRQEIQPDVVIIWGTETSFAYLAAKTMRGIPMAIYMQGVMSSISSHFYEGLPHRYQHRTLRDFLDLCNPGSEFYHYSRQSFLESEMLSFADAVIVENDWCEDICRIVNPSLRVFRNKLPIRHLFYNGFWTLEKMKPKTIFTNAGGYPIKGHHILFLALAIVKKQVPDFVCYIPGPKLDLFDNTKRRTGFSVFLNRIIKDGDLNNNIVYTGPLTSEEMVKFIESCNVYVMPSMVENHSSSLIEAMIVGAPCISSLVGGTASLINHNQNGILYNSLDYNSLAGYILRVLNDDEFANKLGKNAFKIRRERECSFGDEMLNIYSCLSSK